MLDLPAARHLLHHQLGVHQHLDLGGAELGGLLESRDQPAVLGDVVGGTPDRLLALGQHRAVVGRPHHRAVSRRSRVAARPAVGLDDHLHAPVPLTRNRIAPHSGQRNTSSSAAAEMRASSPRSISIRQAPHRRPCSSPGARAAARPLAFVQRDQVGVQLGDQFVSPRDGLVSQLIDLAYALRRTPVGLRPACSAARRSRPARPPADSAAPRGAPSPPAANPPGWTAAAPTSPAHVAAR